MDLAHIETGLNLTQIAEHPLIQFPVDYGSGINNLVETLYRQEGFL